MMLSVLQYNRVTGTHKHTGGCVPLMTHFIRDSSPEQSMLCRAISRSVGVSRHVDVGSVDIG